MGLVIDFLRNPSVRCLLFLGTSSVLYSLFNRIIMTKFFFDYPIVLLIMQMALLLFLIEMMRLSGAVKLHAYTFQRGKEMFAPSLFFMMAHFLNLNCLDGTTMPLFPFLQRFTPLLIIELNACYYRRERPPRFDIVCISIICFASAAASVYEWSFDLWSIIYGVLALGMESYALTLIEKLKEQYSSWLELVYINAFNSLCLLLVADLLQDEIRDSFMYLATSVTWLFLLILAIMILIGLMFHSALFMCIMQTGAAHSSIIHILAGGIQLFVAYGLSFYLFYDLAPTWTNVFGVIIASLTGIYYYIYHRGFERDNGLSPSSRQSLIKS